MVTIKSYTDIEQSKVLANILPLESADMMWEQHYNNNEPYVTIKPHTTIGKSINCHCCNCWSLAALFSVLPEIQGSKPIIDLNDNYITYPHISDLHTKADNPIDACVAMIEKLYELKLI